jgi:hypothetical protein
VFLHLGGDRAIATEDIIFIGDCTYFTTDSNKKSDINREFLTRMRQNSKVTDASEKEPKSFVVTADRVYLSSISSITLKRRAAMIFDIDVKK